VHRDLANEVARRLRAQGYQVYLEIAAGAPSAPDRDPTRLDLRVMWAAPTSQLAWTALGGLTGALVGLGNIPTGSGSLMSNTGRNVEGPSVYWGGFVVYGAEPLAILSLAPLAALIVLCAWPRPRPTPALSPDPAPDPAPDPDPEQNALVD
jgi:hypothetical protein